MILDLNKTINAEIFKLNGKIDTKSIILVAINTYKMGINNPDIELVI